MYYMEVLITLPKPKIGDITVNVTDGTDAISGATVVLTDSDNEDTSKTTDSDGECTFDNVDPGTYTLTCSKSSYTTQDSQDTPEAIQGATVTIDGDTEHPKTTGSSGGCTATLADGEHSIVVAAEGYTSKTETITTDRTHASFTISLTAASP